MTVVLTTSIDIDATRAEVWDVLSDFASYGQWSNFSSIDGVAEVGSKLAMRMPGFRFSSVVTAATPEEQLEWSAKIISERAFLGRHTFTLSANDDGSTRLTNVETFSGVLVKPFERMFSGDKNNHGYEAFNRALKSRAESRRR